MLCQVAESSDDALATVTVNIGIDNLSFRVSGSSFRHVCKEQSFNSGYRRQKIFILNDPLSQLSLPRQSTTAFLGTSQQQIIQSLPALLCLTGC